MDAGTLRDIAARRYDAFVGALEAMVNVDCGTYTPGGVNRIADLCQARFDAMGFDVERRHHTSVTPAPAIVNVCGSSFKFVDSTVRHSCRNRIGVR